MINDQILVENGYREYSSITGGSATKAFSKCVRDSSGKFKKYFIRVERYDFTGKLTINPIRYSYSVALFESGPDGQDFTLSGGVDDLSVMEALVERVYKNMNCEPDRHNN